MRESRSRTRSLAATRQAPAPRRAHAHEALAWSIWSRPSRCSRSPRPPRVAARQVTASAPEDVRVHRLTDLPGLEETPALSPDGRSVAFTAGVGGKRQVFVQLIAGGAPLQITRDPVDHQMPRWSPDSSSIVYFSPARPGDTQGTVWEIRRSAASPGGSSTASGGADVASPTVGSRSSGSPTRASSWSPPPMAASSSVVPVRAGTYYLYPRWSPDGKWIAFQRGDSVRFDIFVVPASGGEAAPADARRTT